MGLRATGTGLWRPAAPLPGNHFLKNGIEHNFSLDLLLLYNIKCNAREGSMKEFDLPIEKARNAVKAIDDVDLRGRAFEVILAHLLEDGSIAKDNQAQSGKIQKKPPVASAASDSTLPGRILSLKGDGFFNGQQTLSAVRDELRKRGWHYPATSLSGPLQALVRQRELRREQVKDGNKKIWKYSNH